MAKDLPYFKFDVSEWINGLITLESDGAQGLFINICCHYWFKSGKLSLSEIKRRLSGSKPEDFEALINQRIIKVDGDRISITFLDQQLHERVNQAAVNSLNGRKGGRPKSENKPTAFNSLNEKKAKQSNIEEKRREEKRVEENNTLGDFFKDGSEAFEEIKADELMVERMIRTVHQAGFRAATAVQVISAVRFFLTKESAKPEFFYRPRDEIKSYLVNWIAKNANKISEYG